MGRIQLRSITTFIKMFRYLVAIESDYLAEFKSDVIKALKKEQKRLYRTVE